MKRDDAIRVATQSLDEARNLLKEDQSRPAFPLERLGAALERVSTAIAALPQDAGAKPPAVLFAPPPRATGERLTALIEACLNLVAVLGLILVLLVLAFAAADAPGKIHGKVEICGKVEGEWPSAPARGESTRKTGNGRD